MAGVALSKWCLILAALISVHIEVCQLVVITGTDITYSITILQRSLRRSGARILYSRMPDLGMSYRDLITWQCTRLVAPANAVGPHVPSMQFDLLTGGHYYGYYSVILSSFSWSCHGPLAIYVKLRVAHVPQMPGTFLHHHRLTIPTCITTLVAHVMMHAGIAQ